MTVDDIYFVVETETAHGSWVSAKGSVKVLRPDGSFEISNLDAGVNYRFGYWHKVKPSNYRGGYYTGPGKPLAYWISDGLPVRAPASGLELEFTEGGQISGTVTVPASHDRRDTYILRILDTTKVAPRELWYDPNLGMIVPWNGADYTDDVLGEFDASHTASFTIYGLPKDRAYVIQASLAKNHPHATEFVHGMNGTTRNHELVTHYYPGDEIHVTLGQRAEIGLTPAATPRLIGKAEVGQTLTLNPGRWSLPGASTGFRWFRDGQLIPVGGQETQYTLTDDDLGSRISVEVRAVLAGYNTARTTTAPTEIVTAAPVKEPAPGEEPTPGEEPAPGEEPEPGEIPAPDGDVPGVVQAPQVSGAARLGGTLRATAGTWDVADVAVSYQWLRDGKAVAGATGPKFTLKKKDVGKSVSVRVTATKAGHGEGVASSSAVKVAKGKPKVSAKITNLKKAKAGKRAKVRVRVKAAGLAKPRGTVIVKYGKKKIKVKLAANRKGKVTVRLPKLGKGKYKIKVTYKPTGSSKKYLTKASSRKVTLRVR